MRRLIPVLIILILSSHVQAAEIPEDIRAYNEEAEEATNVSRYLLAGLEYCESGFNDHAVNKAGTCFGLCQIYKRFHVARMERLGVADIYDRRGNIMVAADLLGELFKEYEDVGVVLLVYGGASEKTKQKYMNTGKLPKWAQRILNQSILYEEEAQNDTGKRENTADEHQGDGTDVKVGHSTEVSGAG